MLWEKKGGKKDISEKIKNWGIIKKKELRWPAGELVEKKENNKKRPLEQISSPSPFAVLKVLSYVKTSIDREQG